MSLADTPVTSEQLTATTATPQVATTVTTFSPGAGSTVVVRLDWLQGGSGTPTTITVKDSLGNTYTNQLAAPNSFNVAGSVIAYFTYPSGATSIHLVISSSATNANTGGLEVLVSPSVVTGAGPTPAFGPNTINIAPGGSTTTLVTNLTTTQIGSLVYLAGGIQSGSTGTVNANTTQTSSFVGFNNAFTGISKTATVTPGSTPFGWTISPTAAFGGNMIAVELLPASGAGHTATAALTITAGRSAARTRGQAATAALTITAGRSAARTRGQVATAALALTAGRSAARTRGHTRTAALALTAGRSATPHRGQFATAALTITAGRSATGFKGGAHTATAALALTAGRSAARTRGQAATAALALVLGRTAAGSVTGASHTATAALTLGVTRHAAPNTGHVRAAALVISAARSATPSGGHHPAPPVGPADPDDSRPLLFRVRFLW